MRADLTVLAAIVLGGFLAALFLSAASHTPIEDEDKFPHGDI